jgi:glutamate racemase
MIGVIEPGTKAAVENTKSGRIGVIGTQATINSNAYARTIQKIDPKLKIFSLACPLFVPLVEEGYIDKDATHLIALDYLKTMKDVDIDTLVLGCTHYPLLKEVISDVMGEKVKLIESGEVIAKVVRQFLSKNGLSKSSGSGGPESGGEHKFFVSDVPDKFTGLASRFLGEPVDKVTRVDISEY